MKTKKLNSTTKNRNKHSETKNTRLRKAPFLKTLFAMMAIMCSALGGWAQSGAILSFTSSHDTINIGDTIVLTNTSIGFSNTTKFYWKFGDNCNVSDNKLWIHNFNECIDSTIGVTQTISHTYLEINNFEVKLYVVDSTGNITATNKMIYMMPDLIPPCNSGLNCDLICNGSFENVKCVNTVSNVFTNSIVYYWQNPGPNFSPDHYITNTCTNSQGIVNNQYVPDNWAGCEQGHNGSNAYAGIYTYEQTFPNHREYISTQLNSPIVANRNYTLKLYVS